PCSPRLGRCGWQHIVCSSRRMHLSLIAVRKLTAVVPTRWGVVSAFNRHGEDREVHRRPVPTVPARGRASHSPAKHGQSGGCPVWQRRLPAAKEQSRVARVDGGQLGTDAATEEGCVGG